MWTISFALGPRAPTSFESGAGLCLAESEVEIPSFNKLLWSDVRRLHWWPHPFLENFEVSGSRLRLQIGKSPCTKWPLATKGVGAGKKGALGCVELSLD